MSSTDRAVVRVLLQNIEDGDRRKFEAQSNDADSGGGARDLRFRPEKDFLPFFEQVFPHKTTKNRRSKGVQTQIEVFSGEVFWNESGSEKSATMEIWPSTNARPSECRLARISSFGLLGQIVDDPHNGRSVFMLFQQADGTIRIHFTTETSLLNDDWDPKIKTFAGDWIDDGCKSAFIDLKSGKQYPHA